MNLKKLYSYVFLFLTSLLIFIGCGSSNGDDKNSSSLRATPFPQVTVVPRPTVQPSPSPKADERVPQTKGYFINSPIEGADYVCADGSNGLTDAKGMFECEKASVTFKVGQLTFGTLKKFTADGKVYLQDLLGLKRGTYSNEKLKLLAQLIQSLDDDGLIEDKITITKEVREALTKEQNFKDMTEYDVRVLLRAIKKDLVGECGALSHLGDESIECESDGSYYVDNYVAPSVDTTKPIITLNGANPLELTQGLDYTEAGATATDNRDGTVNVVISGDVNVSKVGTYTITYKAKDKAGNETVVTRTVNVINKASETLPPLIKLVDLSNGDIIQDTTTQIKVKITDDTSVDSNSIEFFINDINKTSEIVKNGDIITYTPTIGNPLNSGQLKIEIKAQDDAGNRADEIFILFVQPQTVHSIEAKAHPQTAYAPSTIKFIARVNISKAIERYYWDFDGDGTFDTSETVANTHNYTYNTPDDYNVTLKTVDTDGVETNSSVIVKIKNRPPVISANIVPSNGEVPLNVSFNITATDNEGVKSYEIDFDGDGTYDYNATSGSTSHIYTTVGDYSSKVRVTDNLGVQSELSIPTTTVIAKPVGSPSVTAQASNIEGTTPLSVNFSVITTLPNEQSISKYQWDFDNDGTWDYESNTTANTTYTYNSAGTFFAKIKITTNTNKIAEDFIQINAKEHLTLSRDVNTINTFLNEEVSITTTLSGDSDISLIIEKNPNELIKTLVPWTKRVAGTYSDSWDGRDDKNDSVTQDAYYVVLLYKIDGVIKRLDLRDSSGGNRYTITNRTGIPNRFQPYGNNPLKINFTIDQASEVTAFIGRYNSNVRLKTFTNRKAFAKGTHTIIWNGTNADGVLAHPPSGDSFLFGAFGYTLADNSIFVKSRAYVSNVNASPEIYTPTVPANNPNALSQISFELSMSSDVEMVVSSVDTGKTLFYKRFTSLSQGTNSLTWNGKSNRDKYVPAGSYRIGIRAVDVSGYKSVTVYTLQRIFY